MKKLWLIFYFIPFILTQARSLQSGAIIDGPMLHQVEMCTATFWIHVSSVLTSVILIYWKSEHPEIFWQKNYDDKLGAEFNPLQTDISGLEINSKHEYQFVWNNLKPSAPGTFHAKDLLQWRKPAPDFSFLTGSCSYFNDSIFDCPGKPYGGDYVIFESMAIESASFTLWLGDNWYTSEVDFQSEWGLRYHASHDRAEPSITTLVKFHASLCHLG